MNDNISVPWAAATRARELLDAAYSLARAAGWKKCQFCPAPILWAKTGAGKAFPLIPGATPDGNVAVRFEGDQVSARVLRDGEPLCDGEQRGTSHFADCPGAGRARHRKPKAGTQ